MKLFLIGLTLLIMTQTTPAMTVVQNHQSQAVIVIDQNASEQIKKAAQTLQQYIQESTGAILPISNIPAEDKIAINVGSTSYTKLLHLQLEQLDEDGFILQETDKNNFVIIGGSDTGTENGIYYFLEQYLGVRWLMPTKIGEDVPLHIDLKLPSTRTVKNPAYLLRYFSPLLRQDQRSDDPYPRYSAWVRHNRLSGIHRIEYHHNLKNLFPPSKFAKTHPEFYPMIDGKRYIPKDDGDWHWQPNFSAPGIVDAAAEQIEKYFQEHPDASSYSLGINDSPNFDQSAASRSRRSGKKNYLGKEDISDDYFRWANAVAAKVLLKYPDKWFGTLAYNEIADPPKEVEINPHIVPFLTYERLFWLDPELKEHNINIQDRWEKVSAALGWYDYKYGLMYMAPRVYPHYAQKVLQYGQAHHVRYYHAELYPNWGEGPKPWILAKLLWDPNQNVDALIDDWCEHAVGKAAASPLKQYYAIWEIFWTQKIQGTDFWNKSYGVNKLQREYLSFNDLSYLKEIPENTITQSDGLMDEVTKLAKTPQQKERANELAKMWKFYRESFYSYQGEVLASLIDPTNAQSVLDGLKKADYYISATTKRRHIFHSFKNDPLYRDVYLRAFKDGNRGSDLRLGYGLITKAQTLAKTNDMIAAKLEELTHNPDPTISDLATKVLLKAQQ